MVRTATSVLALLALLVACGSPSSPREAKEPLLPVLVALGAPVSFMVPQGWEMHEDGLVNILRPSGPQADKISIAIQPVAHGGHAESVIPQLKSSFSSLPEVTNYSLRDVYPDQIDSTHVIAYRSVFHYFDVPMYRQGYIVPVQDLLVDIAITGPATDAGLSGFILDNFTETIALPNGNRTIGGKGIGAASRL